RVIVRVPGKINLELVVGPRREDGYHELATVLHAVGVYDYVTVAPAADWSVRVTRPWADRVPTDGDNLGMRPAGTLARGRGAPGRGAVTIGERRRVAGGRAGGWADAAAALVACEGRWGRGLPRDALEGIAPSLGSDVPFLLHGGAAIGSGR